MPDPTQRFSDRATYYAKARPKYPAAVLRFFQNELELSPTHGVADVGCGTGLLAELFVRNANKVFGVEPNDAMRKVAEEAFDDWPNFHSINGTAEATTLRDASTDFVTAGQAFHWFDAAKARVEFKRILKPEGVVALVWNDRRLESSPFATGYEQLIQQFHNDPASYNTRHQTSKQDATLVGFFGPSGYELRTFDNPQIIDRQSLLDRLASASYMPLPPDPRHDQMIAAAHVLYDQFQVNGTLLMPHDTRVYFGRLS
jgi:SAM-dependent methyltransferase